ncbi:UPF0058 family protein [Halorubrum sp. DTA46]|uniref:UPF0058 family protein n=1 Tax=Halorubrum sp. DTA46 TaxID=3402162 RepID=UPI003AAD1C1E
MRKKELIQMHALLLEVTRYVIETESVPVEEMSAYYALGVTPLGVHKSKSDHYEAITVLFDVLEGEFERTQMPPVSP